MKINLIRYASSLNPEKPYLQDSENFIEDINNELFEDEIELVSDDPTCEHSFCFIETGGSEQDFVKDYENLKEPIVLLTNSKNNSLPATFEIRTFLNSKNKRSILLFGDEKFIASSIKEVIKLLNGVNQVRNARLGVIGKPSDWLIASQVDYQKVKDKFGATLIDITTEELKEEINKGLLEHIPHKDELLKKDFDSAVISKALEIYSGLKRIIEKYQLTGFTLRCFDLIEEYKNTACLAFSILNEEGILAACEGDVPSLLSMLIIKASTSLASFQANPSKIDLENSEIIFSHCTLPLNMCHKYNLMTHFESNLGIGVRGEMEKGEVTIFKLAPSLKRFLLIDGRIEDNLTLPNYCRTQIKVKIGREECLYVLNIPFGNHILLCYGDVKEAISSLLYVFLGGEDSEEKL